MDLNVSTINVYSLVPALLPALQGLSSHRISSLSSKFSAEARKRGITCSKGDFGTATQEFDLYTDITDSGADFRRYFSASFDVRLEHQMDDPAMTDASSPLSLPKPIVEVRVFDEMVAIATVEIAVDLDNISLSQKQDQGEFDVRFVRYASRICSEALAQVDQLIRNVVVAEKSFERKSPDLMAPTGLDRPRIGWVHKVFMPEASFNQHLTGKTPLARTMIAPLTLKEWEEGKDYYGWGDSIKVTDDSSDWRDGCVVSQYFYFALDRFNRRVPELLFRLRSGTQKGLLGETRTLGTDLRHRISEKEIAYADLLHGIAGACRAPVESYNETWRFADLRRNLSSKLPILQDVLTEIQEKSQRRSNVIVEAMLFCVSSMSLIGLLLSSHDYVAKPAKDRVGSPAVLEAMIPRHPNDILSMAVGAALVGMLIFGTIRFGVFSRVIQRVRKLDK